jgi:hypothetical protein
MARLCLSIALLVVSGTAWAQAEAPDSTREARAHFQQGLAHAQRGDLRAALKDFEAAYTIRPHYSVQYNIGQAHLTLGQVVEAITAFESYLKEGGEQIAPARRQEVEMILAATHRRVGALVVSVPSDSPLRVWIDGTEISRDRLNAPLAMDVGEHTLLHTDGKSFPESRIVSVSADGPTEVRLSVGSEAKAGTSSPQALLVVRCDLPGVSVRVGDLIEVQIPPVASLVVPEGLFAVAFARPGYHSHSRTVTARRGSPAHVDCAPMTPEPGTRSARLVVSTTPDDAEVSVDGKPFIGAALTPGLHRVRVQRDGYLPQEGLISLTAGKTASHRRALVPTVASRERERVETGKRKTLGLVLGGVGLATAGTGLGLYVWNSGRYDDWQARDHSGQDSATAVSIQRMDDIGIGMLLAGALITAGGAWLYFE